MKSLVEQTNDLLEALELNFEWDEENQVFRLNFDMDNVKVSVSIDCVEEKGILINHGWLPISLPKEKKTAILYLINKVHDKWCTRAHLYLDEDDNSLMAQSMLYVPDAGLGVLGEETFAGFLDSTCRILDDHFKEFMEVAYGPDVASAN